MLTPLRFTIEQGHHSPRLYYKVILAAEKQVTKDVLHRVWGEIYLDDPSAKQLPRRALTRTT